MNHRKAMPELDGATLIADERVRQVSLSGWTSEHDDDHHDHGQLAIRAAELAVAGTDATVNDVNPDDWGLVKKHQNDRTRQLVIAGALIAAEIDRRLRRP